MKTRWIMAPAMGAKDVLENALTRQSQRSEAAVVTRSLGLDERSYGRGLIVLGRYALAEPWRFYNRPAAQEMRAKLRRLASKDKQALCAVLEALRPDLDTAFVVLQQVNSDARADQDLESDRMRELRLCHDFAHPTYVKLCEPIAKALLMPLAALSRRRRDRGSLRFSGGEVLDEAKQMGFDLLRDDWIPHLRNAIAHGSFGIADGACVYHDGLKQKWKRTLHFSEMSELTDRLLAAVNGLALSYERMWLEAIHSEDRDLIATIPTSFRVMTLRREAESPRWEIAGAYESETINRQRQLTVFVESGHLDRKRLAHDFYRTALLARRTVPDAERVFLVVQRSKHTRAFGGYDGESLDSAEMRLDRPDASEAAPNPDNDRTDGIMFLDGWPVPDLARRLIILTDALFDQSRSLRMKVGHRRTWTAPILRRWEVFPKRHMLGIRATVVIPAWSRIPSNEEFTRGVAGVVRRVIRRIRLEAVLTQPVAMLPIGFFELRFFTADHSRRRLANYGLGRDFLCRIVFARLSGLRVTGLAGGKTEQAGRLRIDWNRAGCEKLAKADESWLTAIGT